MGLAFIPLYIRYLGIEAYGLIGLFAILQAWLRLLDMGMTPTLGREMARFTGGSQSALSIRDLLRSIELIAFGVAIFAAVGIAVVSPWLATSWLKTEDLPGPVVAQALAIMGAVTALRFIEGVYRSSIVGLQRQVLFNVINSSLATLRGLGAVAILAWVSPTIQAFFLWQGLISLASLAILASNTYAILPSAERGGHFSLAALRRVWGFAGGMVGIIVLGLLLTQVDKILLSKLLSLSEYGYYTLAVVVAGALSMLVSPITQAWYPRLCQLHAAGDHVALVRSYHQGAQLVTVIVGSAGMVLMVFSKTFLQLWTQDPALAESTARLLSLLVLGNLLQALMWIPYQAQLAHGWTQLTIRINAFAVLIIVPGILWATPRYGAEGAAAVWVSLNAGYVLIGIHLMYRRILTAEKVRWYLQDVSLPLLGAAASVMSVSFLVTVPEGPMSQFLVLAVASAMALAASAWLAPDFRRKIWPAVYSSLHRRLTQ